MKKEAVIEWCEEPTEEFGKVAKIKLPNNSLIYVFKGGWHLKHPDIDGGFTIPWDEINLAVEYSLKLGYRSK